MCESRILLGSEGVEREPIGRAGNSALAAAAAAASIMAPASTRSSPGSGAVPWTMGATKEQRLPWTDGGNDSRWGARGKEGM